MPSVSTRATEFNELHRAANYQAVLLSSKCTFLASANIHCTPVFRIMLIGRKSITRVQSAMRYNSQAELTGLLGTLPL